MNITQWLRLKGRPSDRDADSGTGLLWFIKSHAYVALAALCLLCLSITQLHKVLMGSTTYAKGVSGQLVARGAVCGAVLTLVLTVALLRIIMDSDEKRSRKALYSATALGTVFLLWRLLYGIEGLPLKIVSACASAVFAVVFVFLRFNKRGGSLFAFCALLCLVPVLGIGLWLYCICALASLLLFAFKDGDASAGKRIVSSAVLAVFFVAAAWVYRVTELPSDALLTCGSVLALGVFLALVIRDGLKTSYLIGIVFALGFLARLGYVLNVALPDNQHDVFPLNIDKPRHNSYIWYIYNKAALPTWVNAGLSQYYHPPLHHGLSAIWMGFQNLMGIDAFAAYENIQYFTMFCSSAMMIVAYKLFCEFGFKGAVKVCAFALIAFHPTFYIFAGSINNDPLCTLLIFVAVLYTVRWYKNQSYKNTVGLALAIGCAMLTKLSGAMVAVGTAVVMLAVLFNYKTGVVNNFKRLWKRFVLFGAICFPLGLWWPIRCKVLYDMPLGFVPSLSPNSAQYLGGYNVWERLTGAGSWSIKNVFPNIGKTAIDGSPGEFYDYGIAPYAVKSALFGEYFFATTVDSLHKVLGYIMVYSSLVMIAFSLVAVVAVLRACLCRDRNGALKPNSFIKQNEIVPFYFLLVFYGALVGSYVLFCFKYAHTCTMDFRYIVPTLLISAVFTGLFLRGEEKWKKPCVIGYSALTAVFCLSSFAFY